MVKLDNVELFPCSRDPGRRCYQASDHLDRLIFLLPNHHAAFMTYKFKARNQELCSQCVIPNDPRPTSELASLNIEILVSGRHKLTVGPCHYQLQFIKGWRSGHPKVSIQPLLLISGPLWHVMHVIRSLINSSNCGGAVVKKIQFGHSMMIRSLGIGIINVIAQAM